MPNTYLYWSTESVVSSLLNQFITGLATTAARKRLVLPMAQLERSPPALPPVMKRRSGSTAAGMDNPQV